MANTKADSKRVKRLYPERPLPGGQESLERDAVVDTLLELIKEAEPKDKDKHRLTVIGLYGARGSGKTSVLHGLIERVKDEHGLALPNAPSDGNATRSVEGIIFDPGLSRDKEELPFDLIRFLRCFETNGEKGLDPAEIALAKMDDPERYLNLAKELVPSASRLPDEIAKLRVKLSAADRDLHEALTAWGRGVINPKKPRLLLLIDDIDLCPELAFPLLDWLTRYLRDVPCVAVLCADEDTLLGAVKEAMRVRGSPLELARALLAKHVPLSVSMAPWPAEVAARLLLEGGEGVQPTIEDLRPTPICTIMQALSTNHQDAMIELRLPARPEFGHDAAKRSWEWLIGRLGPQTPRQLKRLHNRVVMEIEPKPDEPHERPVLHNWSRILWDVAPEERSLVFTFILMVEISLPELGLWTRVLALDESLMDDLRSGAETRWRSDDDPDVAQQTSDDEDIRTPDSLLAAFVDADTKKAWSPLTQRRVTERLVLLGQVVRAVLGRRVRKRRALAISLDADAAALVKAHLPGRHVEALDLRAAEQDVRPPVNKLWARLVDQRPRLAELAVSLRSKGGRQPGADVVGKAPASVLCWLGWSLRFAHLAVVYHDDNNGLLTPFTLPSSRLEPRPGKDGIGLFTARDLLIPPSPGQKDAAPPDDQRVLVIDTLRRVNDADIEERFDASTRPMRARLLQMKAVGRVLEPNDYLTVLQDLLDHIHHMRTVEGVHVFHLALAVQDVVAFGLGRQLHSQGVFHLYEWERATQRYVPMGTFPDDEASPAETETTAPDAPEVVRRRQGGS